MVPHSSLSSRERLHVPIRLDLTAPGLLLLLLEVVIVGIVRAVESGVVAVICVAVIVEMAVAVVLVESEALLGRVRVGNEFVVGVVWVVFAVGVTIAGFVVVVWIG